jgi:hypothetical protein
LNVAGCESAITASPQNKIILNQMIDLQHYINLIELLFNKDKYNI